MPDTDDRREHDWNVAERMRYKIVTTPGEVDEERRSMRDPRTHTGDTVQEYYADVFIREHMFSVRTEETFDPRGESNGLSKVPHFDTRWRVDTAVIAKLPQTIVNGRWSDPVANCETGRGLHPSVPVGGVTAWGVYAPDFTDTYTRGEIAPLVQRYKLLRQPIEAASRALYVPERFVKEHGLFDNLPAAQQQVRAWIDECEAKVRTAQTLCSDTLAAAPDTAHTTRATASTGSTHLHALLRQMQAVYE
jgi:hypothetical protein